MANWAYVENGEIKEKYDILPDNWKNISNFHALKNDVEYLKKLNWLPIKHIQYNYDPTIQKLDNVRYKIEDADITEEWDIVDIPNILPTVDEIEKMLVEETQHRLDEFARTKKYDNILSACSYSTDTNDKFRTEGSYCVKIRSETWSKLHQIISDIRSNTRSMPLRFIDIEKELPLLEWPE